MVRKCQTSSKELPTSAQPSRAQDQNVILATTKKKSRQNPPLQVNMVCFDTGSSCAIVWHTSKYVQQHMLFWDHQERQFPKLTTITINWLCEVEDPGFVELPISFYPPSEDDANNFEKQKFQGDNTEKLDTQDAPWCSLPVYKVELNHHSWINQSFWKKLHKNEWIKLVVPFAEGHHPHTKLLLCTTAMFPNRVW